MKRISKSLLLATALLALSTAPASADFGIEAFGGSATNADGSVSTQAGGHPWALTTTIAFPSRLDDNGLPVPDENARTAAVDLPDGLAGSARMPRCTTADYQATACAESTQVGVGTLYFSFGPQGPLAIYNITPPPGVAARFAVSLAGIPIFVDATVRPDGSGIAATAHTIDQSLPFTGASLTFWGVPADPSHDPERGNFGYCRGSIPAPCPAGAPRRPFLTNPTRCASTPLVTTLRAESWQDQGDWHTASFDHDDNGNPLTIDGCERLPFEPSLDVDADSALTDSPTGLDVRLSIPQSDNPDGLATAHLRDAEVTLPEGMTINPASVDGLAACSDAELGLDQESASGCPRASKIGDVTATSPLLEEKLAGGIFVRSQASRDPQSGEMFRIALVLENKARGVRIALPGSIRADAATGRVTTSFRDNPQLPVSEISLSFKGGPRAPLANPPTCGAKPVTAALTAWNGRAVEISDTLAVACTVAGGFAPGFRAGTVNPTGGAFSPFAVQIDRADGQQYLSGVEVELPRGLLARLAAVVPCGEAAVAAGGCGDGSRVGSATVGTGAGPLPFFLERQPVYLAGPYKGAPYSLVVAVRAIAGPYDLGVVIVRQALHVDPDDAHVTVVSDPLPQIVRGVPLRLRSIDLDVDKPGFTLNPTSCAEKSIEATLTSIDGAVHKTASRFQVGDCSALEFKPKLAMRLTGKGRTRTGAHPGLRAVLTQGKGQANVGRAQVKLPRSIVLDPRNSTDPKLVCDYDRSLKADCPASSVVGRATAVTPILGRPLSGDVHLVQGIRFAKNGNRIRTLPTLLVKLRGEVAIDLRAKTSVAGGRLVTTFPAVPDAPVSRFAMTIAGGSKGILVVTRTAKARIDVCASRQIAGVRVRGQNGKRVDFSTRIQTPCAKRAGRSRRS